MAGFPIVLILAAALLPQARAGDTCSFPVPAEAHGARAGRRAAVFAISSNLKVFAVSVHDEDFSGLFTFDLVSGKLLWSKETGRGQAIGLALNPDGTLLSAAYQIRPTGCPHVDLMNAKTGAIATSLEDKADLTSLMGSAAYTVVFNHDGSMLAASLNGGIRVWATATGMNLYSIEPPGFETRLGIDQIKSLAFTPDSADLAGTGRSLHLWHLKTGKLAFSVPAANPNKKLGSVTISGDGALLAADSAGSTMVRRRSGSAVCQIPNDLVGFDKDGSIWTYGNEKPRSWKCSGTKAIEQPQTSLTIHRILFWRLTAT